MILAPKTVVIGLKNTNLVFVHKHSCEGTKELSVFLISLQKAKVGGGGEAILTKATLNTEIPSQLCWSQQKFVKRNVL